MSAHFIGFLSVAAGGGLGAGLRWLVLKGGMQYGLSSVWIILFVNVLGSFLLGLLVGNTLYRWGVSEVGRLFLQVGLLGGFTTYSAFSLDLVRLSNDHFAWATLYIVISVAGGVLFTLLGLKLGKLF